MLDNATEMTTEVPVQATFSKCLANYGLFVGLLALLDFVADLLRFVNWPLFGRMAMIMNILLGVIFLPVWLLCLARELPSATERFEREEGRVGNILNTLVDDNQKIAVVGSEREVL